MEAKEKAKELVDKYYQLKDNTGTFISHTKDEAKQCALIAVDEILNANHSGEGYIDCHYGFWEKVKEEIEKL